MIKNRRKNEERGSGTHRKENKKYGIFLDGVEDLKEWIISN